MSASGVVRLARRVDEGGLSQKPLRFGRPSPPQIIPDVEPSLNPYRSHLSYPLFIPASLSAKRAVRRCVYRASICSVMCPVTALISTTTRSVSSKSGWWPHGKVIKLCLLARKLHGGRDLIFREAKHRFLINTARQLTQNGYRPGTERNRASFVVLRLRQKHIGPRSPSGAWRFPVQTG